jgi:hypothetical protein
MNMNILRLLILWFYVSGCGPTVIQDTKTFGKVSPKQFAVAEELISETTSYMPYDVRAPICFARAFFSAALLAAEGIPSSILVASGATPHDNVHTRDGTPLGWYHVAILLQSTGERMVLDPLTTKRPMVDSKWLDMIGAKKSKTAPGSVHAKVVLDSYVRYDTKLPQSVKAMPKFALSDLERSCRELKNMQNLNPNYSRNSEHHLISETARIAAELDRRGLLDYGDLPRDGKIYCR